MENPVLFPAMDFVGNQTNQFVNQKYTDYNRREDQKLYEQNAKLAYGYSKKAAEDSSTAMLTGMKKAGISPATMTGGMQAFPLSSSSGPSTSSPQADNIPISQSVARGAEVQNLIAQNDNLIAQNELIGAQKEKTIAETDALNLKNKRIKDEDDKYVDLSGQTYGAIKALTDHMTQKASHYKNINEYTETQIRAEVLKAYSSDKSNIENEVLHRIQNNSKALVELGILNQTFENIKKDGELKDQTLENLKKTASKIEQEVNLSKEQSERLKALNVKQMLDDGDYIGALLSFVIQLTGGQR